MAYRFTNHLGTLNPNLTTFDNLPYNSPSQLLRVTSYAPTTAGNPNIIDNNIRILSVTGSVIARGTGRNSGNIGEWDFDATSLFNRDNLVFRPLYTVSALSGFADIQMGRPTPLSASISYANPNNVTLNDVHVIHGLSISALGPSLIPNTIATFQDFTDVGGNDCIAYNDDQTSAYSIVNGFCNRGVTFVNDEASMISFPATASTSQTHSFTTIPRRLSQVNLEQSYSYDSVMRYLFSVDGTDKEVIYPSLSQATVSTSDKVFANAVKILGQASWNEIYQTLSAMPQPKTTTLSRIDIINAIKKDAAILTRNVDFAGDIDYDIANTNIRVYKWNLSLSDPSVTLRDKQTLLVFGNITLGTGFVVSNLSDPPRVIIALKNEGDTNPGTSGNIFIRSDASRIDASLIAEGSVISWDYSSGNPEYYVDDPTATGTLNRQLYIYGSVFSQNTIGWAAKDGDPTCPKFVPTANCTGFTPLFYDLEHFRYYRYDSTPAYPASLARWATRMSTEDKKSSLIIEYDSRLVLDPPPGLSEIKN
jgi:hypothetical protein